MFHIDVALVYIQCFLESKLFVFGVISLRTTFIIQDRTAVLKQEVQEVSEVYKNPSSTT